MNILYINKSDSRCGECGRPAKPTEDTHEWAGNIWLMEGPSFETKQGCGVRWTHLSSDYLDYDHLWDQVRALRPDLEFVGGITWRPGH